MKDFIAPIAEIVANAIGIGYIKPISDLIMALIGTAANHVNKAKSQQEAFYVAIAESYTISVIEILKQHYNPDLDPKSLVDITNSAIIAFKAQNFLPENFDTKQFYSNDIIKFAHQFYLEKLSDKATTENYAIIAKKLKDYIDDKLKYNFFKLLHGEENVSNTLSISFDSKAYEAYREQNRRIEYNKALMRMYDSEPVFNDEKLILEKIYVESTFHISANSLKKGYRDNILTYDLYYWTKKPCKLKKRD